MALPRNAPPVGAAHTLSTAEPSAFHVTRQSHVTSLRGWFLADEAVAPRLLAGLVSSGFKVVHREHYRDFFFDSPTLRLPDSSIPDSPTHQSPTPRLIAWMIIALEWLYRITATLPKAVPSPFWPTATTR